MEAERRINNHQAGDVMVRVCYLSHSRHFLWPQLKKAACCIAMVTRSKWEKGSVDPYTHTRTHSCMFVTSITARYNHNSTRDAVRSEKKAPPGMKARDRSLILQQGALMAGGVGGEGRKLCFLPNSDLVSKPEHTVCKNAAWLRAAPFLPGGWCAL